jgi:ATP-dependent Clp protease ATP-binding subunit ClpA
MTELGRALAEFLFGDEKNLYGSTCSDLWKKHLSHD